MILFVWKGELQRGKNIERKREREKSLPRAGSLPKWSQKAGLGQAKVRSQELPVVWGPKDLAMLCCLPGCVSRIRSGPSFRTQTSTVWAPGMAGRGVPVVPERLHQLTSFLQSLFTLKKNPRTQKVLPAPIMADMHLFTSSEDVTWHVLILYPAPGDRSSIWVPVTHVWDLNISGFQISRQPTNQQAYGKCL